MKTLMMSVAACMALFTSPVKEVNPTTVQSGSIVYEEIEKINIELGEDASQFSHLLPKEKITHKVLFFNEEIALYEKDEEHQSESMQDTEMDGMMVQMKIIEPDNKTYTDLRNNKQIEQREFMNRIFLIEKDLSVPQWKITNNRKTILEYSCIEAICDLGNDKNLSAWFTPSIPIPAGPDTIGNLPGMVLEVDMNQGEKIIRAVSIDLTPVEEKKLVKPQKGKKVTEEKYKAIVNEKLKEMGVENTDGGTHTKTAVVKISR